MAAAAKIAQKSSAAKTPQPKHTPSVPRPAAKPVSSAKPKPAAHHSNDSRIESATAKSSNAGSKLKAAQSAQAAANAQSRQDSSAPDDAAAAAENADTNTAVNGAKSRAPAARGSAKNNATQTAAAKASDAADDPTSADSNNESGLSLIQLLARSLSRDQSLESEHADVSSTDESAPAATDETAADGKTADDPNAIALAMFSQALAAALAGQHTPTANAASADTGGATATIGSATQSPGGAASMQNLMTVLAHDVAADAKGKSDDGATQFTVDPTKTDVTNAGTADSTAAAPNALAHLGVASHFAAQHLRNDTNTADLKSPVGTPGWEDEIGAHLTWMTQKGLETGSLRISPEHLGPVEVNISVQNADASVWFAANHPDTRAALEQALPRLREMFASQGMNLADSGVSRQNLSQQGSRNQSRSEASQAVSGISAVGSSDAGSASAARINLGLVDLYA
jgi:flagellar hook-length control protein FliK